MFDIMVYLPITLLAKYLNKIRSVMIIGTQIIIFFFHY